VQLPRQDIHAVIRISNSLANFHCARNATYVIATLGYLELACCCAVDWVAQHARYMKRSLADFNEIPDYFNARGRVEPNFLTICRMQLPYHAETREFVFQKLSKQIFI
jgi:hypothetical protein